MAHYAFLDENNVVTEVIVGKDEWEDGVDWEAHYGAFRGQVCKRTSYNTRSGIYYDKNFQPHPDQSKSFRKNFAGIGCIYDPIRDAFMSAKPFNSWILNEQTCFWEPPVSLPLDAGTGSPPKNYYWHEETTSWKEG